MTKQPVNLSEIESFLKTCGPNTKLYLGADSERFRIDGKWHADYALVLVCHIDGCRGCRIFGEVQRELDYDAKASKPSMRLMNEVYKIAEFYERLSPIITESGFDVQIHLDLNPDEKHASSIVIQQAIGYIKGTCNIVPLQKPEAFAASYCADRFKDIVAHRQKAVI